MTDERREYIELKGALQQLITDGDLALAETHGGHPLSPFWRAQLGRSIDRARKALSEVDQRRLERRREQLQRRLLKEA